MHPTSALGTHRQPLRPATLAEGSRLRPRSSQSSSLQQQPSPCSLSYGFRLAFPPTLLCATTTANADANYATRCLIIAQCLASDLDPQKFKSIAAPELEPSGAHLPCKSPASLNQHPSQSFSNALPSEDWLLLHAEVQRELQMIDRAMWTLRQPLQQQQQQQQHITSNSSASPLPASAASAAVAPSVLCQHQHHNHLQSSVPAATTAAAALVRDARPSSSTQTGPASTAPAAPLSEFQPQHQNDASSACSSPSQNDPPAQRPPLPWAAAVAAIAAAAAAALCCLVLSLGTSTLHSIFLSLAPTLTALTTIATSAIIAGGTVAAAAGCAIALAAGGAALLVVSTESVVRAAAGSSARSGLPVTLSLRDIFTAIASWSKGRPMASKKPSMPAAGQGGSPADGESHHDHAAMLAPFDLPEHVAAELDHVRMAAAADASRKLVDAGWPCPEHLSPTASTEAAALPGAETAATEAWAQDNGLNGTVDGVQGNVLPAAQLPSLTKTRLR